MWRARRRIASGSPDSGSEDAQAQVKPLTAPEIDHIQTQISKIPRVSLDHAQAMQRAARSAQDLAIKPNTSILVVVDGKNVSYGKNIYLRQSPDQRHRANRLRRIPSAVSRSAR